MKINVIAVGKIKEKYFTDALSEYAKRISRFAEFSITEVSEAPPSKSSEEKIAIESVRLSALAKGCTVALDPCGKQITSEELASFIKSKCAGGISEFAFLIGGSCGLSDELKKSADYVLSFGKMTYPHQLFRVMFSEQIYRALAINNGLPYHK